MINAPRDRIRRSSLFLVCLLVCMLGSGCIWQRQRINTINFQDKATGVVNGQTNYEQLVSLIGSPPNNLLKTADGGRICVWSFGEAKSHAFNLLFIVIGKTNMGLDSAIFYLDGQGVVQDHVVGTNSRGIPWQWWAFGDA